MEFSIFDVISHKLVRGNKSSFVTKNNQEITAEYFENKNLYFKETNLISSFEKLEKVWDLVIKTKYDRGIIYHENIKSLDCFSLTKYYPTRYGFLNQEFIFDFKEGKNTELYAGIFAEVICDLLRNEEDLLKKTIIVPVTASTKVTNEIRFKKLFELISLKSGVANGYDAVEVKQDRPAKHKNWCGQRLSEEMVGIDFKKFKNFERIILIDDVITKGNSVLEFAERLENKLKNKLKNPIMNTPYIFALSLGRTIKAEEVEAIKIQENKDYLNVLSLKGKGVIKVSDIDIRNHYITGDLDFLEF